MIRRSQHSLRFITKAKKERLDEFFAEYQIAVNAYVGLYWGEARLLAKPNAELWRKVQGRLCGKAMKCAYRQAVQMIKSARRKNEEKIYKQYQRVYAKAKKKGKNWNLVTQKWSEWRKGRKFRDKVRMLVFNGNSINLNSDLAKIYVQPNMKTFDLAMKLSSIWGNRVSVVLPTRKHKRYNRFVEKGWELNSSVQLRRIDGKYYVNLFFEKEEEKVYKKEGKILGIDVGVKKLMSTSEGEFIGREIESKINKYKRKKRGSKGAKRAIAEIKDYIGRQVNLLNLSDVSVVVLEDLHIQNMFKIKNKYDPKEKEHRKTLENWNCRLLIDRITGKCEENRVYLAFVPCYDTSRKCSSCGLVDKESRNKEHYKCVHCGYETDADYNAAVNIRNSFLGGETAVPHERETSEEFCNFA